MRNKLLFLFICIIFFNFVSAECFPNYQCGEWGACEDDLMTRICVDTKCDGDDILERKFCGGAECEPKIECGEWGTCNYFDKTNDILEEELRFEGSKERICSDREKCVDSFVEIGGCSVSVPIKVKRTEWCGEELVEIFDDAGNIVGRVQETQITQKLNRIDISFVRESTHDYCSYCFDREKNYDEINVDCGGPSCPSCIPIIDFFDWAFWVSIFSWGIFGLLFFGGLILLSREENFGAGVKSVFGLFRPLTREEALAREEKIMRFVTQRRISGEGFRN
jgi:hypothetical protein